jgi:hypothetical protein
MLVGSFSIWVRIHQNVHKMYCSTEWWSHVYAALKKRESSANWIPTEIVLLVDLVEEELVLLRSKFFSDVAKKLKCSRWAEFAGQITALGHTTRSWQQTRENGTSWFD